MKKYADESQKFCALCRGQMDKDVQDSHIMAKKHGGTKAIDNICLCCQACNLRQNDTNMVFEQYNTLLQHGQLYRTNSALEKVCITLVSSLYEFYGEEIDITRDALELYEEMVSTRESEDVTNENAEMAKELMKTRSKQESKQTEMMNALLTENAELVVTMDELRDENKMLKTRGSDDDKIAGLREELRKCRKAIESRDSDYDKLKHESKRLMKENEKLTTSVDIHKRLCDDLRKQLKDDKKNILIRQLEATNEEFANSEQRLLGQVAELRATLYETNCMLLKRDSSLMRANNELLEFRRMSVCTIIINGLKKLFW